MFWGYIKFSGERDIVVIDGNISSAKYCKILKAHMMETFVWTKFSSKIMPVAIIPNFRQFFFQENGFQVSENWPPQSPYLNIFENLWNYMKHTAREKHPTTVKELICQGFEYFLAILDDYIHRLYRSIPRRINAVLKNIGYHTKY